jgi:hypothetical protein
MKLLSIIFLQTAIILSVIACILPNWSTNKITADINILGLSVKGDILVNPVNEENNFFLFLYFQIYKNILFGY